MHISDSSIRLPNALLPSDPPNYARFIRSIESIRFEVQRAQAQSFQDPEKIGQGCDALVRGTDERGATQSAARRLSGRTTTRLHDAGSGAASASGRRAERQGGVAFRSIR